MILLGALTLFWWDIDFADIGVDEPVYVLVGDVYVRGTLAGDIGTGVWGFNKEHPPTSKWLYGLAFQLSKLPVKQLQWYRAPKRLAALLVVGSLFVVFLIGRELYGDRVGLLAAGLLAAMPHVSAHARIAGHEAVSLLLWSLALYSFIRATRSDGGGGWWVLIGLWFGLATGTRMSNGLIMPAVYGSLLICLLWPDGEGRRVRLRWLHFVWPLIGLTVFVAEWPFVWQDTVPRLTETFGHWEIPKLKENFLGETRLLPWFYYLTYAGVTTPPLILAGLLIRLGQWFRGFGRREVILLIWLLVPFMMSGMKFKQDGIRYVLVAMIGCSLIAAAGWSFVAEWLIERFQLSRKIAFGAIGVLTIGAGLIATLQVWPYQLDYYNFLAGTPKQIYQEKRFKWAWWGEGVQATLAQLAEVAPQGAKVGYYPPELGDYLMIRPDLKRVPLDEARYAVTRIKLRETERWFGWKLIHEEQLGGAPLARLYERRGYPGFN